MAEVTSVLEQFGLSGLAVTMEDAKRRRVDESAATGGGGGGGKGSKLYTFLAKLGLEQYTSAFVARGLTPKHVRKMSDEDLQEQLGMPKEQVWLLKRALGEPTAQPDAAQAPQSAAAVQPPAVAPPVAPVAPDVLANTMPPPPVGADPAGGITQEMMLKMMQLQQAAGSAPGQTAPAGADTMPPPESEEELMMMQMQMQMQMQVQMAIEAGADPTKALEAMGGMVPEATGQVMPGASPAEAAPPAPAADASAKAAAAATNDQPVNDDSAQIDNTMYAIGQVAEESAQLAVSAAAFCTNHTATDPVQIQALAEAAQQAAQRARWSASTMESYEPPEGVGKNWTKMIRDIGKKAADAAEQAAQQCLQFAAGGLQTGSQQDDDGSMGGRMPCKFFLLGRCWKGTTCEFSHEQPDLKPVPLMQKRDEQCVYFARGHCTRGVACPFAHGPEELAQVQQFKAALKKEKNLQTNRFRRG